MAKLTDLLPSEVNDIEDDSDENRDEEDGVDGDGIITELGVGLPDPSDGSSTHSGHEETQDLVTAQLVGEQSMGAALSNHDAANEIEAATEGLFGSSPARTVKFDDKNIAAESASLLNQSRSIGTATTSPGQPSRDARKGRSSKAPKQLAASQSSGKLRRPSQINSHEYTRSRPSRTPKRDLYDVEESPQKPPPSAQSRTSRTSLQAAKAPESSQLNESFPIVAARDEGTVRAAKRQRRNGAEQSVQASSPVNGPAQSKKGEKPTSTRSVQAKPSQTPRKSLVKYSRQSRRDPLPDTHTVEVTMTPAKSSSDRKHGSAISQHAASPKPTAPSPPAAPFNTSPLLQRKRGRLRKVPSHSSHATRTTTQTTHENSPNDELLMAETGPAEDSASAPITDTVHDDTVNDVGDATPLTLHEAPNVEARHSSPSVIINVGSEKRKSQAYVPDVEMSRLKDSVSNPERVNEVPHNEPSNKDHASTTRRTSTKEKADRVANMDGDFEEDESSDNTNGDDRGGGSEEDESNPEDGGLCGQRATLNRVFASLSSIGVQRLGKVEHKHRFKPQSHASTSLRNACANARGMYRQLQKAEDHNLASTNDALTEQLIQIREGARELDPDNSGKDAKRLVQDVYALVFPSLTKVLEAAVNYYDVSAGTDVDADSLSSDSLYVLSELVTVILELSERAANWKTKPPSDLVIIKPVRNGIIAPLKKVQQALMAEMVRRQRLEQAEIQKRKQAKRLKRKQEEERKRLEEEEKQREWEERRSAMYLARMHAEPDARRYHHLRMPKDKPARIHDIDANGEPYERLAFFKPRSSDDPVPGSVSTEAVDNMEWSEEQELALLEGLERFSGLPDIYEKIFVTYCGYRGPLRPFNVSQILSKAAEYRSLLGQSEDAPEWVKCIPVLDF